ncbi:MAG: hypothetical protein CSA45_04440 [Gammaproteobacteria bacterium]|nr:MAG: hypothetical protein CSA45_04440 [Gammaproteobacteria bacterium]
MRIRVLDEAQQDLEESAKFYDNQQSGLGVYYLDSLLADIESLKLYAGTHTIANGCFRLLSKTFPYAIYYLINDDFIDVYAVLDCRRNPNRTIKQLGQRLND